MNTPSADKPANFAAWLDAAGAPFSVREAPMPTPGPDEVVIQVFAVAVNPVDQVRQAAGFIVPSYPWILGADGAGVITAVGSEVSNNRFNVGDRIAAVGDEFFVGKSTNAMFQRYVALTTKFMTKLPDNITFTDGTVLPLGVSTAAGMLFERDTLDLSWPVSAEASVTAPTSRTKTGMEKEVAVVWGGSSSVGACAIQLAKAAGYKVVATARKANFRLLFECGADAAFDYTDRDAVSDLCEWVRKQDLKLAGIAAAISTDDAVIECGTIAQQLDGRRFVSTSRGKGINPVPEMPEGVEASNCLGSTEPELQTHIFQQFMPAALACGQMKCKPNANIVGTGLESLDDACKLMKAGVSGQKIVVKID